MQVCGEHDDGICQHVRSVCTGKQGLSAKINTNFKIKKKHLFKPWFRELRWLLPLVAFQVASGELFHQPVDLLRLPRQPEALQERPQGRNEVTAAEVQLVHVAVHHLFVELAVLSEELSDLRLSEQKRTQTTLTRDISGNVQLDCRGPHCVQSVLLV